LLKNTNGSTRQPMFTKYLSIDDIFSGTILFFGQLSKEAKESRNKDHRYFKRSHSRKISWSSTNEDVFSLLLVSSYSLISSMRKQTIKAIKTHLPQALKQFAVQKDSEDLFTSDTTTTEGNSEDNREEISN
jgi:hypothetical protein